MNNFCSKSMLKTDQKQSSAVETTRLLAVKYGKRIICIVLPFSSENRRCH